MRKKLLDLYRNPRTNGIFFDMSQDESLKALFAPLGMSTDNDFHNMDFDYLYNRSGLKAMSVMIQVIADGYIMDDTGDWVRDRYGHLISYEHMLSLIDEQVINSVIKTKFMKKWASLIETFSVEFDILNPYRMDTQTDEEQSDETQNSGGHTLSRTGTNKVEESSSGNETATNSENDSTYGFNSVDAVPTDKSSGTDNSDYSDEHNETHTRDTQDTFTDTHKINKTANRNITRSMKGNIGNHTNQELINAQREMLRYQIFDTIFDDLDTILTCPYYL